MNEPKPLNQDNIVNTISRVSLTTRKSEKSGATYTLMNLYFKNGLEITYFVDKKDIFGLKDAIKNFNKEKINLEDEDIM